MLCCLYKVAYATLDILFSGVSFYVLRLVASEVAYSHWLHLYDFSMLFDNMVPKIVFLGSATFPSTYTDYIYKILP